MDYLKILYWIIAVLFIMFHGFGAHAIHGLPSPNKLAPKINQAWLSGLGSFIGWLFLYYFLFYRLNIILGSLEPQWFDFGIILVSFIGITGYLPHMVIDKMFFKK